MALVDKTQALQRLDGGVVELGCGASTTIAGAIGVDLIDFPAVDVVGDVYEFLGAVATGALKAVHACHFFEHVPDLPRLMAELERTVRSGGDLMVTVPHWSNPYYFSDPTHKTPFGLYSFSYLANNDMYGRWLPSYGETHQFTVVSVDLRFRSEIATKWGRRLKRVSGRWVNASALRQEFYEENLAHLLPCFEIRFHLRRD